jgi:4-hydroxybenzoate polyprenyltransferase
MNGGLRRWWTYQRERFPLAANGILIAAFSYSALCYSALLRDDLALPGGHGALVAFTSVLLFFLQLRIADEHKDAEDDARYRPYRPVPRGLVTLRELAAVAWAGAVLQAVAVLSLDPGLILPLALAWAYLGLMSREFFAGAWLRTRPVAYMASHMVIMPLIDLFATACDWLPPDDWPGPGLAWFLAASYANGMVLELGRKIRAPAEEEPGVETYTALWGMGRATRAWLAALAASAVCALAAAALIGFALPVAILLATLLLAATATGRAFRKAPSRRQSARIEHLSGLWTLALYLGLGAGPMVWAVYA